MNRQGIFLVIFFLLASYPTQAVSRSFLVDFAKCCLIAVLVMGTPIINMAATLPIETTKKSLATNQIEPSSKEKYQKVLEAAFISDLIAMGFSMLAIISGAAVLQEMKPTFAGTISLMGFALTASLLATALVGDTYRQFRSLFSENNDNNLTNAFAVAISTTVFNLISFLGPMVYLKLRQQSEPP